MKTAHLHFHLLLPDLLRTRNHEPLQRVEFKGRQTIKHLVESLGIPHTEVGRLRVSEQDVGFEYIVQNGNVVLVYPATSRQDYLSGMFDNGCMTIPARFILDNHLGRLAADLRMLGIDADYSNLYQDQELAELAVSQDRILLSRDRQLLMRKTIRFGYLVRSLEPDEQLLEILTRFDLFADIHLFQRCMRCNHKLATIEKNKIEHRLEPLTKKYFVEFKICPSCDRVYWAGSHVERMQARLEKILERN